MKRNLTDTMLASLMIVFIAMLILAGCTNTASPMLTTGPGYVRQTGDDPNYSYVVFEQDKTGRMFRMNFGHQIGVWPGFHGTILYHQEGSHFVADAVNRSGPDAVVDWPTAETNSQLRVTNKSR